MSDNISVTFRACLPMAALEPDNELLEIPGCRNKLYRIYKFEDEVDKSFARPTRIMDLNRVLTVGLQETFNVNVNRVQILEISGHEKDRG